MCLKNFPKIFKKAKLQFFNKHYCPVFFSFSPLYIIHIIAPPPFPPPPPPPPTSLARGREALRRLKPHYVRRYGVKRPNPPTGLINAS